MNAPEVDAAALRRLARGLLFDADAAADVVQEAWLAALRSGREPTQSWLAEAVKRIALGSRRQARRRLEREHLSARPEARPDGAETAERLEVLHALLAALQRLDEPYRGAVVMRYLDDLPPREIARRTGVPVGTARAHVSRGLERLRRDLDGPRGPGREALLGVLGPWLAHDAAVWTASTSPWVWLGGLTMKKVLATALALLGIAIGWSVLHDPAAPSAGPTAEGAAAVPVGPGATGPMDAEPAVIDVAQAAPSPDRVAVAARAEYVVHGAILRGSSEPLPGGHLRLRVLRGVGLDGEVLLEERLQADALGTFRHAFEPFAETTTLVLEQDEPSHYGHPTWITIAVGDEPWGLWGVVAYPLDVEIHGQVIDSAGRGVAGARIVHRVYLRDREALSDVD
ncbi:MAG TPA: RNA polymerase sigma factor, partial [Planctomycetota bacterium]|nr:RNA polymerase sigma factor [Planctomycetota bacterium]